MWVLVLAPKGMKGVGDYFLYCPVCGPMASADRVAVPISQRDIPNQTLCAGWGVCLTRSRA